MSSANPTALPPGKMGWPLIGETLAFAKNPFGFIQSRVDAHGPVFKTSLLFRKTVVISGREACRRFTDESLVVRAGSFPSAVAQMFGGKSLPFLDGAAHKTRKELVLAAFDDAALASYLPDMQRSVEAHFKTWLTMGEFGWLDQMRALAFEVICSNMLGLGRGPELDHLLEDYKAITEGMLALPLPIPGTTFWKAQKCKNHALARLRSIVEERKRSPGNDGLSRMLQARTEQGRTLSVDQGVLEAHHVIIAGLAVFAELGSIVTRFHDNPGTLDRVREEFKQISSNEQFFLEDLKRLHYMEAVVKEVKRLCPIIPGIFGKVAQEFELDGARIPKGWILLWALPASGVDPASFPDPKVFDPDRFLPDRFEDRSPCAFVPQGSGPPTSHKCAGVEYSTLLMKMFTLVLVKSYTWELPAQDLSLDERLNPPQLRSGLLVRLRAKEGAASGAAASS